jgi:tellurite resistance protein TerC
MSTPIHLWLWFHVALVAVLAVEYGGAHFLIRNLHRKAIFSTLLWVAAALGFALVVRHLFGTYGATQYLAGYALEQSLSVDNLFLFLLLFSFFRVPAAAQPRVLFWGVGGAIVMRGAFILAGVALLERFEWVSYLFAAILAVAALRLLVPSKESETAAPPRWFQWLTRLRPVSARTDVFFASELPETAAPDAHPRRMMTVLFVALIAIELTDILFALDSIPAVLSITRVPFIAYTSNILAVMSLRSLFVLLAAVLTRLRFLHYGLAAILLFAAAKMLAAPWLEVGPLLSLAIIAGLLLITVLASLLASKPGPPHTPSPAMLEEQA